LIVDLFVCCACLLCLLCPFPLNLTAEIASELQLLNEQSVSAVEPRKAHHGAVSTQQREASQKAFSKQQQPKPRARIQQSCNAQPRKATTPRSNSDFRAAACKSTACRVKLRIQSNNYDVQKTKQASRAEISSWNAMSWKTQSYNSERSQQQC
jgi:hypothetical protein